MQRQRRRNLLPLLTLALVPAAFGCADEPDTRPKRPLGGVTEQDEGTGLRVYRYLLGDDGDDLFTGGAHWIRRPEELRSVREQIDSANRGDRLHHALDGELYTTYDASNTAGETDWDVFASNWWPMSKNGTAWRWQPGAPQDYNDLSNVDTLSPVEKYDLMFNPGDPQSVPAISHCEYRDAVEDPQNCEKIDRPAITVAGPATKWEVQNQGTYQKYEPEAWWGHCNGWASYVTAEPLGAPKRDVHVRLVDGEVTECEAGEAGCMLWKAGDIEALMTELYFSDQATFAGRRCNQSPDEIETDDQGRPVDVECRDLNAGSFHVAITGLLGKGADHLGTGKAGRPAFIIDHNYDWEVWNFPVVKFEVKEQKDIDAAEANGLVGATGSDYVFNDAAVRFVKVKLDYWMVSDGVPASEMMKPAHERNVAPHEVELNYVLELDANDEILGGEWIDNPSFNGSNSKELHPDFMWMAIESTGYGEGSDDQGGNDDNPYVRYSKVKALLQCANEPDSCAPAITEPDPGTDPGTDPDPQPEPSGPTCSNSCGSSDPAPGSSPACYCDEVCVTYGDCCDDYTDMCTEPEPDPEPEPEPEPTAPSCVDYCGSSDAVPNSSPACYCDSVCEDYGDCCGDYEAACG